ncbi:linear amide C-N hydrolase [Robinsoniella peoriensis]|uniref:linear amide C-N hydrolase n=1 Tax=Robinsoniella peoriensis TaxID=180332 RepID=UPI00085C1B94|nr:choloylglycine hydrolase family protein [Robinsoniella peoriensis]
MCTAMTMQTAEGETFFGRTMDFSFTLDPELFLVPRNYVWSNTKKSAKIYNQYSFIGIGQDISDLIFIDGVNEMGFAAAALYFPGYAHFETAVLPEVKKISIAAIELVNFLLGMCASVSQAESIMHRIRIIGVEDSLTNSIAPLHWMITDKSGKSMVIECTKSGIHLFDNPIGVLSNSPDFEWHMTNLRNYMNVSPHQSEKEQWGEVVLSPFGQGSGAIGLPGDYSPPSRFVRTSFQKSNTPIPSSGSEAVITAFHIMEGVSIPKGVVATHRGTDDFTQYTAFMNVNTGEYFYKTYYNSQIMTAKLYRDEFNCKEPISLGKLMKTVSYNSTS